jgi:hypothetical protein
MAKVETCECCGRDLPDNIICEYCGYNNYTPTPVGWGKKRIKRQMKADRIANEQIADMG